MPGIAGPPGAAGQSGPPGAPGMPGQKVNYVYARITIYTCMSNCFYNHY